MNMDNHVDHEKIVFQPVVGKISNLHTTKSEYLTKKSNSHCKQPVVNTIEENKESFEPISSVQTDGKATVIVSTIPYNEKNKKNHKACDLKNKDLSAKLVFLKWWLDTLGYSRPLRTAWEDDEQSIIQIAAETLTKSPTYIGAQDLSYHNSLDSEVCMNTSKQKAHAGTLMSNINDPRNILAKTNKYQEKNTESFWPSLNSLSSDIYANQTINHSQQFTEKDVKVTNKKCSSSYQNQAVDNGLRFDNMQNWQTTKLYSRHIQDQNESSNVGNVQIPSHKSFGDRNVNKVDVSNKVLVQNVLDISFNKQCENISRECQCNVSCNNEMDITKSKSKHTQNFGLSGKTTLQGKHNVTNLNLVHDERVYVKPIKLNTFQDCDEGCMVYNNTLNSSKMSNSNVKAKRCMHSELEKDTQLLRIKTANTKLLKDNSILKKSSVHKNMSYFSRLAEKRFRAKEHVNNSHEDTSQSAQISHSEYAHVDNQCVSVSSTSAHKSQLKEGNSLVGESLCHSKLDNDIVMAKKLTRFDNSPERAQDQTKLDCKFSLNQHLLHTSIVQPMSSEWGSNNTSSHTYHAQYPSDQVPSRYSVQHDYLFNNANNYSNVTTSFTQQNQSEYNICEPTDCRKSSNIEPKHGSNTSNVEPVAGSNSSNYHISYSPYSTVPSVSKTSSDTDDQKSNNVKWIAGSWSNTSLPAKLSSKRKVHQQKRGTKLTSSSTDTREQRQKEIIERARLLILMLDELSLSDIAWNESIFLENENSDTLYKPNNAGGNIQLKTTKSSDNYSHNMSALKKLNYCNKFKLSIKMRSEENQLLPVMSASDKTANNSEEMLIFSHIDPASCPNQKQNASKKPKIHPYISDDVVSTSNEASGISKSRQKKCEKDCMTIMNRLCKDECQIQQTVYVSKSINELPKASYNKSCTNCSENIQHSFVSSKSELTALIWSKSESNKTMNPNVEKSEREKSGSKKTYSNSNNVISDAQVKSCNKRSSNRQSKELSRRQLETNIVNNASDIKSEDTSVYTNDFENDSFSQGMLVCHTQRPSSTDVDKEISDDSTIKMTLFSLPSLNRKAPIYPKPRPHALGGIQEGEKLMPSDLKTNSVIANLSSTNCRRQSWTKTNVKKNIKISENCNTSTTTCTKGQRIKCSETLNILPPLQRLHSENVELESHSERLDSHPLKMPKSATVQEQHVQDEPQQLSCGTKQFASSLEHSDSVLKTQCRSKCISPEHSRRVCRKVPLLTTYNSGLLLSPLRRKFDRMKYKVSDSLLKITPSPKSKTLCISHHTLKSIPTDNTVMEQNTGGDLEVCMPKSTTHDIQLSPMMGENSCVNTSSAGCQLQCNNKHVNNTTKEHINLERDINITSVSSQRDLTETVSNKIALNRCNNLPETNTNYPDISKDVKICFENKEISNFVCSASFQIKNENMSDLFKSSCSENTDMKSSKISQENEFNSGESVDTAIDKIARSDPKRSKKVYKKSKTHAQKAKRPCTSTFKFLMLLLSDELEAKEI